MGLGDKIDELAGKAKEALGDKTDKPGLEAEGQQQAGANAEQAKDKVSEALSDASRATKLNNP